MTRGRTLIIVLVTLTLGLGAGFALRPVIVPVGPTATATSPPAAAVASAAPRGTQYFAVHLDEARQVVTQCAEGSVRGDECANAEQAVVEAEGRDRFKRFMGN